MLTVSVAGTVGEVEYQWIKDGFDLPGEAYDTYEVDSLTLGDRGWYSVRVTDESKGVFATEPVLVNVLAAGTLPATGLLALSVLAAAVTFAGLVTASRKKR